MTIPITLFIFSSPITPQVYIVMHRTNSCRGVDWIVTSHTDIFKQMCIFIKLQRYKTFHAEISQWIFWYLIWIYKLIMVEKKKKNTSQL